MSHAVHSNSVASGSRPGARSRIMVVEMRCCIMCLKLLRVAVVLLASAGCFHVEAGPLKVVYPATESKADTRFDDLKEILRAALDETVDTDGPHTLQPTSRFPTEARTRA